MLDKAINLVQNDKGVSILLSHAYTYSNISNILRNKLLRQQAVIQHNLWRLQIAKQAYIMPTQQSNYGHKSPVPSFWLTHRRSRLAGF